MRKFIGHWLRVVDSRLIHPRLRTPKHTLKKARLFVHIHLFLFLFAVLSMPVSETLTPENQAMLGLAALFVAGLMYIFRKWGNFVVSGNLLALIFPVALAPVVLETGGLYSDNLLWLLCAPLLAILFAGKRSGLVWLALLLGFTVVLYNLEMEAPTSFSKKIEELGATYFFISYSLLFVVITAIVLIFAQGQTEIIGALHEKQLELEAQKREIEKQAEELRKTEEKLRISNRELEQFAYAASHDLKEPLRMIGTYIQLIQRSMGNQLDAATNEYMHFVTDGVERMQKLLNDLLEYSRLGRRKDSIKPTNLNDILLLVLNNLMATMNETHAAIYANELPVVKGSSTEMIQLFQNLLANSIKFRKKDTVPEIRILHTVENGMHLFRFEDNGIGIPKEAQPKVFGIFERVHSKSDYEGTGIGLATVKKIVKNMGGEIWLESEVGKGTTFFFTFPMSAN